MIISINAEKAFDKIQIPCMIKTLRKKKRNKGELTQLLLYQVIIRSYKKPTSNIILSSKRLNAFLLRSGTR